MRAEVEELCRALDGGEMSGIIPGQQGVNSPTVQVLRELEVTEHGGNVSSDPEGFWRWKAVELTQGVLDKANKYAVIGVEHEEDPLVPLRKALEGAADIMQMLEKLKANPSDLGRELNGVKRSVQSLREAMLGARRAGLLHRLINDQTWPGIMGRMP